MLTFIGSRSMWARDAGRSDQLDVAAVRAAVAEWEWRGSNGADGAVVTVYRRGDAVVEVETGSSSTIVRANTTGRAALVAAGVL